MDVDEHRPADALARLEEALVLDRARGDEWAVVADTVDIAGAQLEARRPREAYRTLCGVAAAAAALRDPDMTVALVELLAVALAGLADPRRAARLLLDEADFETEVATGSAYTVADVLADAGC
jgi:hypothetical protein